jgi:hypothetical protein
LVGGRRLEVDDDGLASDADDDPEKLILTGKLVLAGVFAFSSIAAILLSAVAESAAGRNEKKRDIVWLSSAAREIVTSSLIKPSGKSD